MEHVVESQMEPCIPYMGRAVMLDWSPPSCLPGPDPESLSSEISLRVPTLAELRNKPSSFSSTEPGSASQDTSQDTSLGECQEGEGSEASGDGDQPLVLPDEEEVQADTALVSLPEVEKFKNSDDSDSQAS